MNKTKILSLFISGAVLVTSVGCSKKITEESSSVFKFKGYPIQTEQTLTYWVGLNASVAATTENLGLTPFGEELQKKTGINIKFIHPPVGQEKDQFNIMLAANDMPDIIENYWYTFPGGPQKALEEKYILKINDLIESDSPNFKKFLNSNPTVDKMVKTDDGSYYGYNFIRGDEKLLTFNGPIIRKDWLDELNLPVPQTISEWRTTLKTFKDKKGAVAPLSFLSYVLQNGEFVGAYGSTKDFYVENGKVKYGPVQPEYIEFLKEFSSWYKEGLIDNNIANVDSKSLDANMLNGKTGATVGFAGSGLGKWINAMKDKDPKFNLVAAPHVVLNKGEKAKFGQYDLSYSISGTAAISASSKNAKLAAHLLDYGYSEEGNKLYNFGIEGVSYEMVNGYPKYTDLIMKNPEKLSITYAMSKYIRGNGEGPFVQSKEYIEQYYELPQQKDALLIWGDNNIKECKFPRLTPSPEESSEIAKIMNDVSTYVDEMTLKYIMGLENTDNYDKYLNDLKKFNIDRAVELYQNALDRYNKR